MSLPTLINYDAPVPPLRDLPVSRAAWTVDPERCVVLVHDLQRYFVRPYAADCSAYTTAVARTAEILTAARAAGVPVVYTAQTGLATEIPRGLQGDLWGPGMSPIPEHTEILEAVAPQPQDTVLVKHRYSAFAHSQLSQLLADHGRDQLVITGVYAQIGVTATAYDAFMQEVQPFLVADAVADFNSDSHRRALELVASCLGVVTLAGEVCEALADTQAQAGAHELAPAIAADPEWVQVVRDALVFAVDEEFAEVALAEPERDLFTFGMNSLRAFDLLDELAEAGVEIDFGQFTRNATCAVLLAAGERRAVSA